MENKSKLNTVLLVIIIILLGVGLTYIFFNNNSKQKVGDTSSLNYPQDNQNTESQIPVTQMISFKSTCGIAVTSKGAFIFNYPDNFSTKEIIPPFDISGETSAFGSIEIKPKDRSDGKILISKTFEACDSGGGLCNLAGGGFSITTSSNNPEVVSAYNKILSTLKFDNKNCSTNITNTPAPVEDSAENSLKDIFKNQPGAIKSIKIEGNNQWTLAVDLLSINANWIPGVDSTGGPLLNQNTLIRNLTVTANTKTYNCGNSLVNTSSFITNLENTITRIKSERASGTAGKMEDWTTVYFDIDGSDVTAIHDNCI